MYQKINQVQKTKVIALFDSYELVSIYDRVQPNIYTFSTRSVIWVSQKNCRSIFLTDFQKLHIEMKYDTNQSLNFIVGHF